MPDKFLPKRRIMSLPRGLTWINQVRQYNRRQDIPRGPGLHYWQVPPHIVGGTIIHCLIHRDGADRIDGILNYFPHGTPHDEPGDFLVLVREDRQRQGLGTLLVTEAMHRWDVDLNAQCVTPEGYHLLRSIQRRRA